MMTPDSFILYLVIVSQSLLLGAACVALLRVQRRFGDVEDFWNSPTGAMLADAEQEAGEAAEEPAQPYIMTVGTEEALIEKLKLDQRVNELQRKLNELVEQSSEQKSLPAIEFERSLPIEHALRMAKNGASVDDLTRTCGLNIGEARLLKKLHGRAAA
jgi:hypothetical protein